MTNFERIRKSLGYTSQQSIAVALGMSQPNVSKIERGQEVFPEVARNLIALAKDKGVQLSFDEIYAGEVPQESRAA